MQADDEGNLENVAMPGFVDILSSVITVFMFFMLIVSATMFFMSIQMKKAVVEETKKEAAKNQQQIVDQKVQDIMQKIQNKEVRIEDVAKPPPVEQIEQLQQENQKLTESLTAASTKVRELEQMQAMTNQPNEQKLVAQDNDVLIVFTDTTISLSDASGAQVRHLLQGAGDGRRFIVEAPDSPDNKQLSASRELALGRMLNVRNILLTNKVPADRIIIRNTAPQQRGGSYNWVRIHVDKP